MVVILTGKSIEYTNDLARFVIDNRFKLLVIEYWNRETSTVVWVNGVIDFFDVFETVDWVDLVCTITA